MSALYPYVVTRYQALWTQAPSSARQRQYRRALLLHCALLLPDKTSLDADPCPCPLRTLPLLFQGGWAIPRSVAHDDDAQERRKRLPEGLHPKWRHQHRSLAHAMDCVVCRDPVCDCGNPAWGCTCSEEGVLP